MRVFKPGKSWYAGYRVGGKRRMRSFGRNNKMADLFWKALELKEIRGELQIAEKKVSVAGFSKVP